MGLNTQAPNQSLSRAGAPAKFAYKMTGLAYWLKTQPFQRFNVYSFYSLGFWASTLAASVTQNVGLLGLSGLGAWGGGGWVLKEPASHDKE